MCSGNYRRHGTYAFFNVWDAYKTLRCDFPWFRLENDKDEHGVHRMLFHWFYKDDLSADDSRPEELLELVERQTLEYVENNSSDFEEEFPALENEVNSRYMRLKRRNPAVLSYSEKKFLQDYDRDRSETIKQTYLGQMRQSFWDTLNEMWSFRKQKFIEVILNSFGPKDSYTAEALAALIIDIHLLGDWTTKGTKGLPDVRSIAYDLADYSCIGYFKISDEERTDQLISEIMTASMLSGTEAQRAAAVIEKIKQYFPGILAANDECRSGMESKGIVLTAPAPQEKAAA
jgi:hypothetical protein